MSNTPLKEWMKGVPSLIYMLVMSYPWISSYLYLLTFGEEIFTRGDTNLYTL